MCALSVCHEEGIGLRTLRDTGRSKVLKPAFLKRPSLAVHDGLAALPSCWSYPVSSKPRIPGGHAPVRPRPLQRARTLPQPPPLVSGEVAPHHLTTQPRGRFWYFLLPSLFSPETDLLTVYKYDLVCVLTFYPDSCVHHRFPFSGAWERFCSLLYSDPARCLVFVDSQSMLNNRVFI